MAIYNGYPYQYAPQGYQQNYPQQTPQIQNGGIVSVPNIDYARNYIVMPGTTVTFVDENAPYVYTKTRKSQFEQPVFEKLRLVREEDVPQNAHNPHTQDVSQDPINTTNYATKAEIEALSASYQALQAEVDALKKEKENE